MNRKNIDFFLYATIMLLFVFNLLILYSASCKNINLVNKTLLHMILSIIIMFILSNISYRTYEKIPPIIYIISIILLIFVLLFGTSNKGASRWIKLGFIKFQPSEFVKISVPLMISYLFKKFKYCNSFKYFFISLILIFIPTFLVAIQPDLGTSILILFSGLFSLFISGIKLNKILFISVLVLIILIINWFFFIKEYQKNRILVLLNPNLNRFGIGYHIIQSKIAIGSGGLFGKGLFNGTQNKLKFIPESHTDFIFSVIAEEFGLIGVLFLLFLYFMFIFKVLLISINSIDMFTKITIYSFILTIFLNIFLNISMVTGLVPVVGIPLPFISYGGSSLLTIFIKIGIIISMSSMRNYIIF